MTVEVIWDASPLVHAHKVDRLDVLGDLARGSAENPWRNFTTAAVVEELAGHNGACPDWLQTVHVDGIAELSSLALWLDRVATSTHSKGEATVLAWADCHKAIAIVDDADARRVAQSYGLEVHGLLWAVAAAINCGRWTAAGSSAFVDQLLASGARYPFESGGFEAWASKQGLLGQS